SCPRNRAADRGSCPTVPVSDPAAVPPARPRREPDACPRSHNTPGSLRSRRTPSFSACPYHSLAPLRAAADRKPHARTRRWLHGSAALRGGSDAQFFGSRVPKRRARWVGVDVGPCGRGGALRRILVIVSFAVAALAARAGGEEQLPE